MKKEKCDPKESRLKSFFVGPQSENAKLLQEEFSYVLNSWFEWRKNYFPNDGVAISPGDQQNSEFKKEIQKIRTQTEKLFLEFSKEIPKFSPRYLGHMSSEISMPAMIGHLIALLHNPNNISKEASWVGVEVERKAVQKLSQMLGYPKTAIGHFTSGGTIANFEAVLRAKSRSIHSILSSKSKDLNQACYSSEKTGASIKMEYNDIELQKIIRQKYRATFQGFNIIVPDSKHYSWTKAASIFGLGDHLVRIPLNKYGQLCTKSLKKQIDRMLLKKQPILNVVSVLGTTELGTIDPIHEISAVLEKYRKEYGYNFWHHLDAAYGGFFASLKDTAVFAPDIRKSVQSISKTTSLTIDPHKLGYVPYSAGVFICQKPQDYFAHEITAPYVDFKNMDLGPYTLEGSRPATGAAAMYMTAQCIGLNSKGYGLILQRTIQTGSKFIQQAQKKKLPFLFVKTRGTNIICFAIGGNKNNLAAVNKKTETLTKKLLKASSENQFFISKTTLGENYQALIEEFCKEHQIQKNDSQLHLVRLTLMNPFTDSIHSNINYLEECMDYIQSNL